MSAGVSKAAEFQGAMEAAPSALAAWAVALGHENVRADEATRERYARTTLPSATRPLAVIRPKNTAEVRQAVQIASRYGVPVYAISRGKNWGLGEACAVTDAQVILDLSRMDRIVEVDEQLAYAVIEPGVTQGQLYDYIQSRKLRVMMDVTGAGPDASIVGNVMERGYGHTPVGDRFHNSCAYEVVLADGRVINTGYSAFKTSKVSNVFKTGLGPSLDGLFTQSNLGIVTRMTVWLMPQPEAFVAYAFRVKNERQLAQLVDALAPLRMSGMLQSAVHIANDLRVLSGRMRYPWELCRGQTPMPQDVRQELRSKHTIGAWNVLGAFYGQREIVRASRAALRRALKGIATPIFIGDATLAFAERLASLARRCHVAEGLCERVEILRPAYDLLRGRPVAEHLLASGWRCRAPYSGSSTDPLDNEFGFLWLTPVVPLVGSAADELVTLSESILNRYGFDSLATLVMANSRAMCCPITICFDKSSPSDAQRASDCYDELFDTVTRMGYFPYRLGIQSMRKLKLMSSSSALADIKHALDAHGTIAPGRYLHT